MFDLDPLCCDHAGRGEQTGEPTAEVGVPNQKSTVGTKLGNAAGEFLPHGLGRLVIW